MKKTETDIIYKAYEYLSDVTPLSYDCGKLCGQLCCKGNDNDGMLLFPGEEKIFENLEGFSVYYDNRYESLCVRCNGKCDRKLRPLSCRIFPYFIYLKNEDSKPVCAADLRAGDFCVLLKDSLPLDKKFLRALRVTALLLCSEKSEKNFLIRMTETLTDFNNL